MRFSSTNTITPAVSLGEAVNHCIAADGGMFMPETLPSIPRAFFNNISEMSMRDIAFVVATNFLGDDVEPMALKNIVDESFAFDAPLKNIEGDNYVLELFNGPTLTFKDYGARFMARLMRYLDAGSKGMRNILVATTGNTGAAAANGFYRMSGVNVTVLYPKGKLTRAQASQITALGENIHAVEILGSIEDCKRLVRQAICDSSLSKFRLTGANSINIARLIPQMTFALYAYSRLSAGNVENADKAMYIMPTGNMSNVVASVMAKMSGCPMGKVVAAVGANNQVAPMIYPGESIFRQQPLRTLAHAIDMSIPSGWPRLRYLFRDRPEKLIEYVDAAAPVSDEDIVATVLRLRNECGYNIDTHGAVAYATAERYNGPVPKVIFATGHPAKQIDIITKITGRTIELPVQLTRFMSVKRPATLLAPTIPALRKYITTNNNH